jgi:hypothetical protein
LFGFPKQFGTTEAYYKRIAGGRIQDSQFSGDGKTETAKLGGGGCKTLVFVAPLVSRDKTSAQPTRHEKEPFMAGRNMRDGQRGIQVPQGGFAVASGHDI